MTTLSSILDSHDPRPRGEGAPAAQVDAESADVAETAEPFGAGISERLADLPASVADNVHEACDHEFGAACAGGHAK